MRKRFLLLCFSILFSVLLAEALLRIASISYASVGMMDPIRGWALRPGSEAVKEKEGYSIVVINDDGIPGQRNFPFEKPEGTFRVAVLGDSFTFASQIERPLTYPALMEETLRGCAALADRTPEVINFGIPGYGTAQELLTFRHHASKYDPDFVVLGFFTGNDLVNNSRALSTDRLKPFFVLEEGELVIENDFVESSAFRRKTWVYDLLYHSRIAQIAKRALLTLEARRKIEKQRVDDDEAFMAFKNNVYLEPTDEVWKQAWEVTEALLVQVDSEVREHGLPLLVVTLTNPLQVYPEPQKRHQLHENFGIADPMYPDDRLTTFADAKGIQMLNLAPGFLEIAQRDRIFLHGFENTRMGTGHWNEAGHRLAADAIAGEVCAILTQR